MNPAPKPNSKEMAGCFILIGVVSLSGALALYSPMLGLIVLGLFFLVMGITLCFSPAERSNREGQ